VPRATDGLNNGSPATRISERRWGMVDRAGGAALARHHPLTVEGEDIGSFDLLVACGADKATYDVSYIERRQSGDHTALPAELGAVTLRVGTATAPLKVASSERRSEPDQLVTFAAGAVPASLVGGFAAAGNHSVVIETKAGGLLTVIRLGNTGAQANLPQLAASCGKALGDRAELPLRKTGGLAAAQ
jgi:hypothetical protein